MSSEVWQGGLLSLRLFSSFINDLKEGVKGTWIKHALDIRLGHHVYTMKNEN